jgi:hypothetical protein
MITLSKPCGHFREFVKTVNHESKFKFRGKCRKVDSFQNGWVADGCLEMDLCYLCNKPKPALHPMKKISNDTTTLHSSLRQLVPQFLSNLHGLGQTLCSPNEDLDGRTNFWERTFEVLWKGEYSIWARRMPLIPFFRQSPFRHRSQHHNQVELFDEIVEMEIV